MLYPISEYRWSNEKGSYSEIDDVYSDQEVMVVGLDYTMVSNKIDEVELSFHSIRGDYDTMSHYFLRRKK